MKFKNVTLAVAAAIALSQPAFVLAQAKSTTAAKAAPAAPAATAGATQQTATEAYMAYRAAFDKSTKLEDLMPYVTAAQKKQMMASSPQERTQGFQMMKMMNTLTSVKVTKEASTAAGATLTVEGVDADKAKTTGTIKMVKEGGAWKLGEESWKSGN
jgi:hypothetical protein